MHMWYYLKHTQRLLYFVLEKAVEFKIVRNIEVLGWCPQWITFDQEFAKDSSVSKNRVHIINSNSILTQEHFGEYVSFIFKIHGI